MMASNGKPNQKMNKKNVIYRRKEQLFSSLKLTIYLNTNTDIQFDLMLEDIIIWCQGKRKQTVSFQSNYKKISRISQPIVPSVKRDLIWD